MSKYLPAALVLALLHVRAQEAGACAVMSPDGRAKLAGEQTIIVWDEARHTEHFIRRLGFNTGGSAGSPPRASSIGFLVPTPNVPAMAEVSGQAFERLQYWMRPRVITHDSYRFFLLQPHSGTSSDGVVGGAASVPKRGVQVLAQQQIGSMQASVLRGGAPAVVRWLRANGYPSRPSFEHWLAPYAAKGWVITAFKFSGQGSTAALNTTTVRLSFAIDKPFYPYREPAPESSTEPVHQLALYVFASGRVEGRAGASNWKIKPEWSQPVAHRPDLNLLLSELKLERSALGDAKSPPWMTGFVDSLATRPDEDLQFRAAKDQTPIEPPPIVSDSGREVYVPLDLAGLALLGLGGAARRRRRNAGRVA